MVAGFVGYTLNNDNCIKIIDLISSFIDCICIALLKCVCARARARTCVRACVRVCVCVCVSE